MYIFELNRKNVYGLFTALFFFFFQIIAFDCHQMIAPCELPETRGGNRVNEKNDVLKVFRFFSMWFTQWHVSVVQSMGLNVNKTIQMKIIKD